MLEMVLLKPFHPSCDLMESVNGWCLFDSADSQGDGDKSPEPRGENTENQSLLENFDVFDFVLLKLHILVEKLQIKQNPDCYFSCFQLSCSLSSVLPFLTHID